jgi:hypothetical protein
MKYKIIVYDWNPNGTNDIAIEGSTSEGDPRFMDGLPEALFGLDICKHSKKSINFGHDNFGYYVPLQTVLKYIAVSPVSNGNETIKFLSKYFKSVGGAQ